MARAEQKTVETDPARSSRPPSNGAGRRSRPKAVPAEQFWAEATLDVLPEIVFVVDVDGVICTWNRAAEKFFGLSKRQAIGQPIEALFLDPAINGNGRALQAVREPRPSTVVSICCESAKGKCEATLTAVAVAAPDESEARSIVFIHPQRTGDNRDAGESLREVNDPLAKERMELAASQDKCRQLEKHINDESERAKSRSREIRSETLYSAMNDHHDRRRISESLHDNLAQLLVANQFNLLRLEGHLQNDSGRALLTRIKSVTADALDYARYLMAELSPPVLNEQGLGPALGWLGGQMARRGLAVSVDPEVRDLQLPECESVIVFEAVRHLLTNVVEHAQVSEAQVTVDCDEDSVSIRISDTGAGFDAAETGAGSDAFSGRYGLSRIRERLESVGGAFTLVSSPGRGTVGTITIPRITPSDKSGTGGAAPYQPAPGAENPSDHGRAVQVIVVDDHDLVRSGIRGIVASQEDMEVVGEAADGLQAIELTRKLQPDVVIMDVNMPRLGGVEATKYLSEAMPETAVVGLSIWDDEEIRRSMIAAGARAFITKGGPSEELFAAIRQSIGGR